MFADDTSLTAVGKTFNEAEEIANKDLKNVKAWLSSKKLSLNIAKTDYSFPPDENTGRRFQYECLTRFPWLAYSAAENGSFCINCVLFGGESMRNVSKLEGMD